MAVEGTSLIQKIEAAWWGWNKTFEDAAVLFREHTLPAEDHFVREMCGGMNNALCNASSGLIYHIGTTLESVGDLISSGVRRFWSSSSWGERGEASVSVAVGVGSAALLFAGPFIGGTGNPINLQFGAVFIGNGAATAGMAAAPTLETAVSSAAGMVGTGAIWMISGNHGERWAQRGRQGATGNSRPERPLRGESFSNLVIRANEAIDELRDRFLVIANRLRGKWGALDRLQAQFIAGNHRGIALHGDIKHMVTALEQNGEFAVAGTLRDSAQRVAFASRWIQRNAGKYGIYGVMQ